MTNRQSRLLCALLIAAIAVCASAPPALAVGTILLVVNNSASLDGQETAKKNLMIGWGYTVVPFTSTSAQAAYDAACLTSSCAYISETVTSTDVAAKLTNTTIPVIDEEAALSDELGFSASMTTFTDSQINITNTTHYITSAFAAGTLSLFTSGQPVRYLSGTLGSFTTLGQEVGVANATLAVFNRGDTLTPSGTAAGKRVYLPWGNTGVDITMLTANGQTMMKRTIEWALMPVAWYKLDDASGTTALDSASGCNGTLVGPTWTTGKVGGGLKFNGTSDYVTIASNQAFQFTNALTICGWMKCTGSWNTGSNVDVLARKGDTNPCVWQIDVANSKLESSQTDAAGAPGNTTLLTNKWYHLAGTWDGAYVRLYVNGVLDNTPVPYSTAITPDTRPIYIGGHSGSSDVTNGILDDVRFYNRALTPAEIAALANVSPSITSWSSVAP